MSAKLLKAGMNFHREGRLRAAEDKYRAALAIEPNNGLALHYLGLLLSQTNRHSDAEVLLDKSILLMPNSVELRNNRGFARLKIGRFSDALADFEESLELNPTSIPAELGRGQCLARLGNLESAIKSFKNILCVDDQNRIATCELADLLRRIGDPRAALRLLDQLTSNSEQYADLVRVRALALLDLNDVDSAIHFAIRSDRPSSADPTFLGALGEELIRRGKYSAGLGIIDYAVSLEPNHAHLHEWRSICVRHLGRYQESVASARRSVLADIRRPGSHFALGVALQQSRRFIEAARSFQTAISLNPNFAAAEMNAAFALLLAGEFAEGWELFERRARWNQLLDPRHVRPAPNHHTPEWDGACPIGSKVLLIGEQGIGDELMFGSLLFELTQLGFHLVLQVDSRLKYLFQRSIENISVISHEETPPQVDCHLRLGSLATHFRTSISQFESSRRNGYLIANPVTADKIRCTLKKTARKTIGISWKTINPADHSDRSITPTQLGAVLRGVDVNIVNLQYGTNEEEWRDLQALFGAKLIKPADIDLFDDLDDVASLTSCCDLVVTVGNSIAHFAGALGVPAAVLIPFSPGWRWMGENQECLWYSSVTLIRQQAPTDWNSALANLATLLSTSFGLEAKNYSPYRPRFHTDREIDEALIAAADAQELGAHTQARMIVKSLSKSHPDDELINKFRAADLLLEGKFPEAIGLLRSSRIKKTAPIEYWNGMSFYGDLLVVLEPNLGEEILLAGLLPNVIKFHSKVSAEVDGRLLPLFKRSLPSVTFIPRGINPLIFSDSKPSQLRLASSLELLEHVTRNSFDDGRKGWLIPDQSKVTYFRKKYHRMFGSRLLVGVSWSSLRKVSGREPKSLDANVANRILAGKQYALIDLDYCDDTVATRHPRKLIDGAPYKDAEVITMTDLDLLSAQISSLDAVITVSNSTAHLAGSLGISTTVALSDAAPPLWHWGSHGLTTPWYNSVKLIRFPNFSDPSKVVTTLAESLTR